MSTASEKSSPANTFEGQLVSITGTKLVMTGRDGKEYSHQLAQDAGMTCDGNSCCTEDLKAGSRIRVTTKHNDRKVATAIECLDSNPEFAACGH